METKAKKKTSNIIMVLLIAVIVVCGILAVGMLKGWFGGSSDGEKGGASPILSEDVIGVANMERSGVGYSLEKDVTMESGDIVETKSGSEAAFQVADKNKIVLGEKTEVEMTTCEADNVQMEVDSGEIFLDLGKAPSDFVIAFGDSSATADKAVFSISKQSGSAELNVYGGEVTANVAGEEKAIKEGYQLQIFTGSNGGEDSDTLTLQADSLNAFMIKRLQACDSEIYFSQDDLAKVVADREAEKEKAAKALEQEALAVINDDTSSAAASENIKTCTISINCKTILSNMDNLAEGKSKYVPRNGVILATSKVQFRKGDTVFDVLKRTCSAAGIQLEYSNSPTYGGKYVEGINHLYEFDCGKTSGWMYKVNGWYPNYGCSSYKLKDGDNIVWTYTCSGN